MESLKDRHKGQAVWIVGKGPSLANLKASDIGEGPVITLNQAILAVEPLGLPNLVYSMQKDGGARRRPSNGEQNQCPDCDFSGQCGDTCGDMVRPKGAILLLHEHESKYCFPDYPKRHVLDWKAFGLSENVFSLILAVKLAQHMGCNKFNFISCDAHVNGTSDCYVPGKGITHQDLKYICQRQGVTSIVEGLDCKWITPGATEPAKPPADLKISFGCITNDAYRLNTVLKKSDLPGELHYLFNPESATKGLNRLLDIIEAEGADVAVLAHQDMHFQNGWLPKVRQQLALLPDSWVVAGIIGKCMNGLMCGNLHDMRIVDHINTTAIHSFPQPAACFDECVIIVNMAKGFRFDEALEGFDLYGTLCVLQAWEMGGTAWIIDAFAEHYCMRPFSWFPDDEFKARYKRLFDRFEHLKSIDSTVFVSKPRFETSAAA